MNRRSWLKSLLALSGAATLGSSARGIANESGPATLQPPRQPDQWSGAVYRVEALQPGECLIHGYSKGDLHLMWDPPIRLAPGGVILHEGRVIIASTAPISDGIAVL